jgi:DNA processing protein
MALGIDSAAHEGALQAGGPTVAVLAGGADVAYPRSKRTLHAPDPLSSGAVLSEAPPASSPALVLPARNRIIAGLASATIVVQAAARSGSLITAELAMDLGPRRRRGAGLAAGLAQRRRERAAARRRHGRSRTRSMHSTSLLGVGHGLGTEAEARTAGLDPALRTRLRQGGGGQGDDRRASR